MVRRLPDHGEIRQRYPFMRKATQTTGEDFAENAGRTREAEHHEDAFADTCVQ